MRIKGKVVSWNDAKGFGFVEPCAGGKNVFIHMKALSNRARRPEIGQLVTYALSADNQGRPCAVQATLAGDRLVKKAASKINPLSIAIAGIFFVFMGTSVLSGEIPYEIFFHYLAASSFSFIAYAVDKSKAQRGAWRIQESTLHLLSLIGGWPGALVAHQVLRHKRKKLAFLWVFRFTVLVNCGVFIWLVTPTGLSTAKSFIQALLQV